MGEFLARCIRSRWISGACAAVLAAALLLPPQGLGIPICSFKLVTHLPCLGCGLTRSFIGMAHLRVKQAGFYHPVGVAIFPVVVFLAALLPAPARVRERLAGLAESFRRPLNWIGVALLVLFVVYGLGRIVWLLVTSRPSPW